MSLTISRATCVARAGRLSAFPVVMGTGIVSVTLSLDGHQDASRALLVITAAAWIALAMALAWRGAADRPALRQEGRSPSGLSAVAASAVLGTRVVDLGWTAPGIALLVVSFGIWLALAGSVLHRLTGQAPGSAFMVTVSTEALAVLAATIAASENATWLLYGALVPAVLGIGSYPLIFARFDLRELGTGGGDQWIAGGALAISALAVGQIIRAASRLGTLAGAMETLRITALCLWVGAALWLPLLLAGEIWRPRVHYDPRRWSTVFPLGMYAACSFTVGAATQTPILSSFARLWVWPAVVAWTIAFAGLLGRGRLLLRAIRRA